MTDKPNPGSAEAVDQGCTCPIIDNNYGKGYLGQKGIFVQFDDCPLHGGFIKAHLKSLKPTEYVEYEKEK